MLLTHRKLLQSKAIASIIDLRGTLRNFGLKVGVVGMVRFEARIKELVENLPDLAVLVEPLLIVRRTLREQIGILDRRLLAIVRDDEVCRRLMTVPGVGPVVAASMLTASRRDSHRSMPADHVEQSCHPSLFIALACRSSIRQVNDEFGLALLRDRLGNLFGVFPGGVMAKLVPNLAAYHPVVEAFVR
jgi:hypothetical protein